ncbi:Ig-like domain-containing protein [Paraglaciecola sp. L3A3]|uniref:Ig-like domain-containing protein n=1 Tax=Paraglaciecola sp. L3A3 TaxID=2686358 RepID=UPI00131B7937|nr:Ig-like domain-containing protein [Paraglaciecola sp. L3A3]
MKINVFSRTFACTLGLSLLTACGGDNEGFESPFKSKEPAQFANEKLVKAFDESQGILQIDLFEGATSDGISLSENSGSAQVRTFQVDEDSWNALRVTGIWDEKNLTDQQILDASSQSLFRVNGSTLLVDTDMLDDHLHANGDVSSHTYKITFNLDNGYDYPADSEVTETIRYVELTFNGIPDEIEGISGSKLSVPLDNSAQAVAWALPEAKFSKAYQDFSWQIADTDIATVDAQGLVTGKVIGSTTLVITSNENSDISYTLDVDVVNPPKGMTSIELTTAKGEQPDALQFPACSFLPLTAMPIAEQGQTLSGDFVYDWTLAGEIVDSTAISYIDTEKTSALLTTPNNDNLGSININAELLGADSPISDSIEAGFVTNHMCKSAYDLDGNFDKLKEDSTNTKWTTTNGITLALEEGAGLSGNAFKVTLKDDASVSTYAVGITHKQWSAWGQAGRLYNPSNGSSVGKQFKASIWVKVVTNPDNQDFSIRHSLINRRDNDYSLRNEGPEWVGDLDGSSTEWQYVEFVNTNWDSDDSTDTSIFTVPATGWDQQKAILLEIYFNGLNPGDSVLLDNFAVYEAN